MPLPLMNHSALALFAQRTRNPTPARSIGFCVIWVCTSSSSSSSNKFELDPFIYVGRRRLANGALRNLNPEPGFQSGPGDSAGAD